MRAGEADLARWGFLVTFDRRLLMNLRDTLLAKSATSVSLSFPEGGEGRGEEGHFYWVSPLPDPLPTPPSWGENLPNDSRMDSLNHGAPPLPRSERGRGWRLARVRGRFMGSPLSLCVCIGT